MKFVQRKSNGNLATKMESESEEPQPSTSNQTQIVDSELDFDKELNRLLTVEEFLIKSKTYLLEYEKHMFLDTIDSDCLVVGARLVSNIAVNTICLCLKSI